MERTMSVEDKIRRAEEIYYRRRQQGGPTKEGVKRSTKEKKDIKLFRKLIKQILICIIIYSAFYLVINNNYIFSEDFTNEAKEIMSQDINFVQIYSTITNKIKDIHNQIKPNNEENNKEQQEEQTTEQNIEGEENSEKVTDTVKVEDNQEEIKENIQNNDKDIGGAEDLTITEEVMHTEEISQMEQDANYIKSTISFIKPVNGTISSMFGMRNPTTSTVPKNHTGTDIAADTGTKIISATDGKVILASTKGDYGKHLKIQIDDVIIVYAHCNKLYVKEGDTIKQGEQIAEVGSTGNTTGPHLHFEIRYQDRYVNPQLILEL